MACKWVDHDQKSWSFVARVVSVTKSQTGQTLRENFIFLLVSSSKWCSNYVGGNLLYNKYPLKCEVKEYE